MHYTVYKITNKINNKEYTGAHKTSDLDDGYLGSGKYLKNALNKYGKYNFKKDIIFRAKSSDIMYWVEKMIVDDIYISDSNTYNLKTGGSGGWDFINNNNLNGNNFQKQAWNKNIHMKKEYCKHCGKIHSYLSRCILNPKYKNNKIGSFSIVYKQYPYCNILIYNKGSGLGNYVRWHGNNCSAK